MKKFILIFGALLLVGCGPSQEEKREIAKMACTEIMATRNFEEARRIKILNEARLEVGLKSTGSSLFEASIRLGGFSSCIDYIIPPPPPTKAQREAEEENRIKREKAAQRRAEAARLKREEEERIAAENAAEAARKVEEEKKYIAENTKTTYLACPSLAREGEFEYVYESGKQPQRVQTTFGPPKRYAYIELNEVEGDNPDLNGYITSTAYWDIARVGVRTRPNRCGPFNAFTQEIWPESWCLGEYSTAKVSEGNYGFKGPLYGRKILKWPHINPRTAAPGSNRFIIDKVTLIATSTDVLLDDDSYPSRETQYQCEVVTKDTFDEKIQEAKTRVQAAVDGYKAEKAAEEAARKAEEPQI